MPATTGYQAGVETSATQLSYAVEAVWGTLPATQFQAIRYMRESLAGQKQRQRPQEIITTREMSAAVTTQETAAGGIDFALSYGTYDDLFSVALGADWQAAQAIAGVTGDITLTNVSSTSATLSSTTAGKFTALNVGQWVRLLGFTNAANNGFYRVTAKASATSLTLASLVPTVTETPAGAAAQVRASTIANGTLFKSVYLQQQLSASLFLRYPGTFVSGFTLTGGVGNFIGGSFTVAAQNETNATTNASTGAVMAAPSGRVHDSVGNFGGVYLNETALAAVVDQFSIQVQNTGAQAQFGMGSAAAAGMLQGVIEVTGNVRMFFKDFTYYTRFKSEALGALEFITKDPAGNAYVVTVLNAALMNPKIEAGGPGQAVYAAFDLEGNPASGGGTIQLDRLPAV